jgi:hypothetical protein
MQKHPSVAASRKHRCCRWPRPLSTSIHKALALALACASVARCTPRPCFAYPTQSPARSTNRSGGDELVGVPHAGVHRAAVRHVLRGGAPASPLRRRRLPQPRPETTPPSPPPAAAGRRQRRQRGRELVVAGAPGQGSGGDAPVQKGIRVQERVDVPGVPGRLRRRRAGARAPRVQALLPGRLHRHVAAREHHVPRRDHAKPLRRPPPPQQPPGDPRAHIIVAWWYCGRRRRNRGVQSRASPDCLLALYRLQFRGSGAEQTIRNRVLFPFGPFLVQLPD